MDAAMRDKALSLELVRDQQKSEAKRAAQLEQEAAERAERQAERQVEIAERAAVAAEAAAAAAEAAAAEEVEQQAEDEVELGKAARIQNARARGRHAAPVFVQLGQGAGGVGGGDAAPASMMRLNQLTAVAIGLDAAAEAAMSGIALARETAQLQWIVVAVGGPRGSGKQRFAEELQRRLGDAALLPTDCFARQEVLLSGSEGARFDGRRDLPSWVDVPRLRTCIAELGSGKAAFVPDDPLADTSAGVGSDAGPGAKRRGGLAGGGGSTVPSPSCGVVILHGVHALRPELAPDVQYRVLCGGSQHGNTCRLRQKHNAEADDIFNYCVRAAGPLYSTFAAGWPQQSALQLYFLNDFSPLREGIVGRRVYVQLRKIPRKTTEQDWASVVGDIEAICKQLSGVLASTERNLHALAPRWAKPPAKAVVAAAPAARRIRERRGPAVSQAWQPPVAEAPALPPEKDETTADATGGARHIESSTVSFRASLSHSFDGIALDDSNSARIRVVDCDGSLSYAAVENERRERELAVSERAPGLQSWIELPIALDSLLGIGQLTGLRYVPGATEKRKTTTFVVPASGQVPGTAPVFVSIIWNGECVQVEVKGVEPAEVGRVARLIVAVRLFGK